MANEGSFDGLAGDSEASGDINSPEFNGGSKSKIKAISNGAQALAIANKLNVNDLGRDIRRSRVLGAG